MNLSMNRGLIIRMIRRLNWAVHDIKDGSSDFAQLMDMLCVTGFELDTWNRKTSSEIHDMVCNVVSYIRDTCMKYEFDALDGNYLITHCVPPVVSILGYVLEWVSTKDNEGPTSPPLWELFLNPEPVKEVEDKAAEELQAEKSVKRQQTLTRIIVMQTQMDNMLQNLESDIIKAFFGEA